jgi:hypothetical protein
MGQRKREKAGFLPLHNFRKYKRWRWTTCPQVCIYSTVEVYEV